MIFHSEFQPRPNSRDNEAMVHEKGWMEEMDFRYSHFRATAAACL